MNRNEKRHDTLEVYEMAKKLGVELDEEELKAALGTADHKQAVSRCEKCGSVGECHFFMEGEVSNANNKRWWVKEFCPNSDLILRLAEKKNDGV
jgi:hypothetical protein